MAGNAGISVCGTAIHFKISGVPNWLPLRKLFLGTSLVADNKYR